MVVCRGGDVLGCLYVWVVACVPSPSHYLFCVGQSRVKFINLSLSFNQICLQLFSFLNKKHV